MEEQGMEEQSVSIWEMNTNQTTDPEASAVQKKVDIAQPPDQEKTTDPIMYEN